MKQIRLSVRVVFLLIASLSAYRPLRAELVKLEIQRREPFANGVSFGDTGPYEKLVGVARFAVDPSLDGNRVIVDLDLAARHARGTVEFAADFYLLASTAPAKG